MPLQGQSLGLPGPAILLGVVCILTVFYIMRRAKGGFRSRYVRLGLDIAWGIMVLAIVLWLIAAE